MEQKPVVGSQSCAARLEDGRVNLPKKDSEAGAQGGPPKLALHAID